MNVDEFLDGGDLVTVLIIVDSLCYLGGARDRANPTDGGVEGTAYCIGGELRRR